MLDLTNEIARNGFIYFPEFCKIVTKKYRDEDQEVFRQNMFKVGYFFQTQFFAFKIKDSNKKKYKELDKTYVINFKICLMNAFIQSLCCLCCISVHNDS